MKKNLFALVVLACLSVSVFAGDGQVGATLADDGQVGATKSCPAQQTCLNADGQVGATRSQQDFSQLITIWFESVIKVLIS